MATITKPRTIKPVRVNGGLPRDSYSRRSPEDRRLAARMLSKLRRDEVMRQGLVERARQNLDALANPGDEVLDAVIEDMQADLLD